jgi:HTH-type transcriptional regulator/antitoxin HigA
MSDELRPILTSADHIWAMGELGRLWGAAKGTAEGNRLDILATLIDVYEAKTFPMGDPDPTDAVRKT